MAEWINPNIEARDIPPEIYAYVSYLVGFVIKIVGHLFSFGNFG